MTWLRARFHADPSDYRPVTWPPPGPFWCTGYGPGYATVVAYVRTAGQIREFWPEASSVETTEETEITFTSRFQRPEWWTEAAPAPA